MLYLLCRNEWYKTHFETVGTKYQEVMLGYSGTRFTCFTGTKVQILAQKDALDAYSGQLLPLAQYLYFCTSKASKLCTCGPQYVLFVPAAVYVPK